MTEYFSTEIFWTAPPKSSPLIKGNCGDPRQYEMCLQQSFIINSWWCICFILLNKAFYRFWFFPFLQQANASCCRLWTCTLLFPRPAMCCCCPGAFHPGIALVPCLLGEDQTTSGFFSTLPLPLFVPLEMSLVFHFIQQPTFIKPAKTSGVFSSHTSHLRHISDCLPSSL